jgi:thiol-disulfide isomerase/thioredoxin
MKESVKKEIRFWVILMSLFGVLYVTGWHTEVIGRLQQVLLYTNLFQPTLHEDNSSQALRGGSLALQQLPFTPVNESAQLQARQSNQPQLYFINFWATWCPPCVAEMPDIAALKAHTEEQGWPVQFVMVSLDDQMSKAKAFLERKELDFPIYALEGRLPAQFDIGTIPSTYVLNSKGDIIAERHGMARYHTDEFVNFLQRQLPSQSPSNTDD